MLPMLKSVADGSDHRLRDLVAELGDEFGLPAEERAQLLPSGRATVVYSRVQWARAYLKQAGLVEAPARGLVRITEEGHQLLAENPPSIGLPLLMRYPSFVAFLRRKSSTDSGTNPIEVTNGRSAETPEEALERVWQTLRDQVAAELLERLGSTAPEFFERLVVKLLVAMGYGGSYAEAASVVGRSGDEGIDGVIKEDPLDPAATVPALFADLLLSLACNRRPAQSVGDRQPTGVREIPG
jgi:restriction system protein